MTTITPIETGSQAKVKRRSRPRARQSRGSANSMYAHYRRLQLQAALAGRIMESWAYALKARQVTGVNLRDVYTKTTSGANASGPRSGDQCS